MPATLPHPISLVRERKASEPVMSAAEQTRLSWARLVRSLEELPPAYHSFFAVRPAGEAFPYAVLTPTFAGFMRRETEKLVCCLDDRLIILEKTFGEPKCTAFSLNDLNHVEVGGVLLKAWLKLQGRANGEAHLTTVTLRYNAVTDRLFTPFVERVARSLAAALGPLLAGALLQRSLFGWPLVCAGALKAGYDLVLYAKFARRRPAAAGFAN